MLYPFLYSIQNDRSISRLVDKSQLASYRPSNYSTMWWPCGPREGDRDDVPARLRSLPQPKLT